ncbi:NAD+ synthase (glutamine-hydrolysing) [Planomonospora parontospora subsp. parontospora]|uniref:Glutamine-dependent NAD(+) synthetase n=2 Tax=Planomonospora parontospora TaxID=58119 RepID=A0AA37F1U1_9ACTN|nr:NAD+ synthase [Planomonospora parontospora]GGK46184.1 NAD+ synthase (glutamine-hydrolysing) [Planomonospora parontospora]GII06430.1 NAD+ synthase (glutamine-hydrolysing) [Planomonospora parontospora subsp. parontospora]
MAQLRIALAQTNPAVGDLTANADKLVEWTRRAADRGAHLAVFTEMFLTGYPVEDLVLRNSFVEASIAAVEAAARRLAEEGLGEIPVVVGYVDRADRAPRVGQPKGAPLDAAALLYRGQVVARTAKHHLPNYGVFDEYRYFVRGDRLPIFRLHGVDVAIAVCEDLWQDGGPVAVAAEAGAGLLVVPNASPYEREKDDVRLELVSRRAREAGCALAYANQVGGQDELVFDGDSIVVSASGELVARAARFTEELLVTDLDLPEATYGGLGSFEVDAGDGTVITVERLELSARPLEPYDPEPPSVAGHLDDTAEVYSALVLAVRDYVAKNGFRSVILGLSGGIDSALTATIASDAIGPDRVHVVLMPSRYSSDHSLGDAQELVDRQGVNARVVPIAAMVEAFEKELSLTGLSEENLQARVRGMILMGLSNEHGHLVLTTGNKSELATGYSTLYGDSAGGFAPIKDVLKTLVWELARWRNAQAGLESEFLHGFAVPPIPENSITKEPSAELRPGQRDTDSLPEYDVLDRLLDDYVEKDMGSASLVAAGHDPDLVARVIRLVDLAEYKRRQYPPGPKITPKNFGRDRRLPITNRWRETAP